MQSSNLRSVVSIASVAIALCLPAAAQAQAHSFDVPAQAASIGVRTFAKQAGIQVIVASQDTDGRTINQVKGNIDTRAALDQLLARTGLAVRSFDGKVAILGADSRAGAEAEEELVVTGSRIARLELQSAMPISVTHFEDSLRLGRVTAMDSLRRQPALAPGLGDYENANTAATLGLDAVNLRNLGTNRSLALIDGRRRVSDSPTSSAVNLKMIPTGMIDRIEVVTGGAAAVYGADAVTGAVNVITRKDFKGLEVSAYRGISQYGDAPETNISLVAGGSGAGMNFLIGGTYNKSGTFTQGDRDFSRKRLQYMANPLSKSTTDGIPDNGINRDYVSIFISRNPVFYLAKSDTFYNYNPGTGVLSTETLLKSWGSKGETSSNEGATDPSTTNIQTGWYFRSRNESYSAVAKFDYAVTDAITYAARLDYGRVIAYGSPDAYREDSRTIIMSPFGGAVAYLDNPYLPASVRNVLTANGLSKINIDRRYTNWPELYAREDREDLTISQDLSGDFTHSIHWAAFYQFGRATDEHVMNNIPLKSRWLTARDVIADPLSGAPTCRDASARAAGCTPINIFSNDPLTAVQKAWLFHNWRTRRISEQQIFGGSLTGKLFTLPAGDLSFAAGVEHRTEKGTIIEDPLALSGDALGVASCCSSASLPIDVSMNVSEAFTELVVPILRDKPFFRRLEVEGAFRYSRYNAFGSTQTWKVGGTWSPVSGVTLRGVRSRSVRVPNFGELYQPVTTNFGGTINDPCLSGNYNLSATRAANCKALGIASPLGFYNYNLTTQSGGNAKLAPETSNSVTAGIVFQPRFLRGLDVTIDYWNIKIQNIITSFSLDQMAQLCVDLPTTDNQFCGGVRRDTSGHIVSVSTQLINAAKMSANGIDVGINYQHALGQGQLRFGFVGSYLLQRQIETIPGVATSIVKYAGGYTDPRFRASLLTSYSKKHYNVSLDTRFISAAKYDPNAYPEQYEQNHVNAVVYNDVSVSRGFDSGLNIGLGVRNIFDVTPALLPSIYLGGNGRYDTVGRYFFTQISKKF